LQPIEDIDFLHPIDFGILRCSVREYYEPTPSPSLSKGGARGGFVAANLRAGNIHTDRGVNFKLMFYWNSGQAAASPNAKA